MLIKREESGAKRASLVELGVYEAMYFIIKFVSLPGHSGVADNCKDDELARGCPLPASYRNGTELDATHNIASIQETR